MELLTEIVELLTEIYGTADRNCGTADTCGETPNTRLLFRHTRRIQRSVFCPPSRPVTAVSVTSPRRNSATCPLLPTASRYCERSIKWRTVEREKYSDKDLLYRQNLYTYPAEIRDLNHVVKVQAVLVTRGQYTDISTFLSNLLRATKSAIFLVSDW